MVCGYASEYCVVLKRRMKMSIVKNSKEPSKYYMCHHENDNLTLHTLVLREHRYVHATKGIRKNSRNFSPHFLSTAEERSLLVIYIDSIVILKVTVGAKMLYSTLVGRRTFYTRVEDTLKIKLTADIEIIYHHLTLQYNL